MIPRLLQIPSLRRRGWQFVYDLLSRRMGAGNTSTFLNYGYLGPENARVTSQFGDSDPAYSTGAALYLAVVGKAHILNKDLLEIGCGRGYGAQLLREHGNAHAVMGIDISPENIRYARAKFEGPRLSFRVAEAERLPAPDGSFDAVVNIESSHCYTNQTGFLTEVRRVLRPAGHFLYADFRPLSQLRAWREGLLASGFVIERERDISVHVRAAMEMTANHRAQLINNLVPKLLRPLARQFAGLPGSRIYQEFSSGQMRYLTFCLRRK